MPCSAGREGEHLSGHTTGQSGCLSALPGTTAVHYWPLFPPGGWQETRHMEIDLYSCIFGLDCICVFKPKVLPTVS